MTTITVAAHQCQPLHVESVPAPQHLVKSLYEEHVCISPSRTIEIEALTRNQLLSNLWHEEHKL